MSLTFPANPSLNQEYTFDNVTYIWDGQKWTVNNTATLSEIYVNKSGDTMTGPLLLSSDPTNSLGAATKQYADANGGGGGGGGGGSTTPVPQKVAYLKDEKPSGAYAGAAVVGWQDITLNTKDDANNLVVLSNDKEFTLSAGEYQIEWSAPGYQVGYGQAWQTKLTNVTDNVTQQMGTSEYNWSGAPAQTRSFGSTRVKITSDTTYKIEQYCTAAGVFSVSGNNGEPEIYAQVTITDLAIVGGTGTESKTNIYGTAKAYSRIVPSEITGTTATPSMAGVYSSKGIVGVGKTAAGRYFVDFETGLFKDDNYIFNGTATFSNAATAYIIYEDQRLGIRTATRIYIATVTTGYADAASFDITVYDNEPAEVALTTFGDIINYSGAAAWGTFDGSVSNGPLPLISGLNIQGIEKTDTGTYTITFTNPMPDSNYSVTATGKGGVLKVDNALKTPTSFVLYSNNVGTNSLINSDSINFTVHATNALPPKGGTGTDAWALVNTSGTADASFNCSVSSVGTGARDVVFTTPMPTSNYAVVVGGTRSNLIENRTTTGFRVTVYNSGQSPENSEFSFSVNCTNATLPLTVTTDQIESAINNPGASAWGKINEDGTLADGMNIASVVVDKNAERIVTFQTPMPNANYSVVAVHEREFTATNSQNFCTTYNTTATGFTVRTKGGGSFLEAAISFQVFATNALPPKGGTGTDAWASCAVGGAIEGSFNIASVTKVSTGLYDVLFTTPMPTNKYAVSGTVGYPTTTNGGLALKGDKTVNGFSVQLVGAGQVLFDYPFDFAVNATNATLPSTITDTQAQQFLAFINSGGLPPVAFLSDQKPAGTTGGAAVKGWQTRTLNTEVDADGIVTLSNDEFTLKAGTYDIEWSAPARGTSGHQTKLTNVTDGTTQKMGSAELSGSGDSTQSRSFGSTRVKITTDTTYKIEHYCNGGSSNYGLGSNSGSGEPNIITEVKITGTPS